MTSEEVKHIDSSDGYEDEAFVHQEDLREAIHNTSVRKMDIVKCIGQLTVEFNYPKNGNYRRKELGTATVISVVDNSGIIITCAHNVRVFVVECTQCHGYYNINPKYIKKKDKCIQCRNIQCNERKISTFSNWKMIKQTNIKFRRRSIKFVNFGEMEGNPYACCVEAVDDVNYRKNPVTHAGYDIAILSFTDSTNYYRQYCRNIILEQFTSFTPMNKFHLFGYPGEEKIQDKMYGGSSSANVWEFKVNSKTNKSYFKHSEIDSSKGQSGAALFCHRNGKFVIFAIHCGGHPRLRHNIGNLIHGENFCNFNWKKKCFNIKQDFEQMLKGYNTNSNKKEKPISISIRTGTKTTKLKKTFTKNDQIYSIQQAYVDEVNPDKSPDKLVFIKANKTLQSDKTLKSYGITQSCTITLKFKVIGGMIED